MKADWGMFTLPISFMRFFPFFCFSPELSLSSDVAAVTFCGHIFCDRADRFAGNNFSADSGLNWHFELLHRDHFEQFLADRAPFASALSRWMRQEEERRQAHRSPEFRV